MNEKLRALYKGALQGSTMGLADEAIGGIGALYARAMAPELFKGDSFSNTYAQARDLDRAENKQLEQNNPWIYGGANLAGGVAMPLGMAGQGLKGAVKAGGIAGGLTGYGMSEKTNPYALALDTATGAGLGAGAGAALYGAGKVATNPQVQKFVKDYIEDESGALDISPFLNNFNKLDIEPDIAKYKSGSGKTQFDIPYYTKDKLNEALPIKAIKELSKYNEGVNFGEKKIIESGVYKKEVVDSVLDKLNKSDKRKYLKDIDKNYGEQIKNIHKKKNLNFNSIGVNDLKNLDVKSKIYKSPNYGGRQSSEYYIAVLPDGDPAFIRKSNHWGKFSTNVKDAEEAAKQLGVSVDDAKDMADQFGRITSKEHFWDLIGGDINKKTSQAGYIKLKDILE